MALLRGMLLPHLRLVQVSQSPSSVCCHLYNHRWNLSGHTGNTTNEVFVSTCLSTVHISMAKNNEKQHKNVAHVYINIRGGLLHRCSLNEPDFPVYFYFFSSFIFSPRQNHHSSQRYWWTNCSPRFWGARFLPSRCRIHPTHGYHRCNTNELQKLQTVCQSNLLQYSYLR